MALNYHERMQLEIETGIPQNIPYFGHVDNHNSGHRVLRDILLEIMSTPKSILRGNLGNMRKYADENCRYYADDTKYCFLARQLCKLSPLLQGELSALLTKLCIEFTWTIEDLETFNKNWNKKPISTEQSESNWNIEKAYIFYWVEHEKDEKTRHQADKGGFFMQWDTDGQRIASCYYRHHVGIN